MSHVNKIRLAVAKSFAPWVREFGGDGVIGASRPSERFFLLLNLLLPVFAGLYVFLTPMPFSSLTDAFFYLSVTALLILLFARKTSFTLRWPVTWPFALFFIWAVIGLFWALDLKNSIHDLRAHFIEYLIIFYLLVNYFNTPKKLEGLSSLLITSVAVLSLGSIIHYYFIEGYPFTDRLGYSFKHTHTNLIGFMNVVVLPLALYRLSASGTWKSRLIFSICIALLCLTALLTQSRAALIGLFAGIVIMCFENKKFLLFILPVVLVILILPGIHNRLAQHKFTEDIRSKINRLTVEIIKDHPVTGIGFGMQTYGKESAISLDQYNKRLPHTYQQEHRIYNSPHNSMLDIAMRTGLVGLALHFAIILTFLSMLWKTYRRGKDERIKSWVIALLACLTSSLIGSLFEDVTFGAPAVIQYAILAMIMIVWNIAARDIRAL